MAEISPGTDPGNKDGALITIDNAVQRIQEACNQLKKSESPTFSWNMKKSDTNKARTKKADDEDEDEDEWDDDGDEDDDEEEPRMGKGRKLESLFKKSEESHGFSDATPILKRMARESNTNNHTLKKGIKEGFRTLFDHITVMEKALVGYADMHVQTAALLKETYALVKAVGDTPMPIQGIVAGNSTRFPAGNSGIPLTDKGAVLSKCANLIKEGKMTPEEFGVLGNYYRGAIAEIPATIKEKLQGGA